MADTLGSDCWVIAASSQECSKGRSWLDACIAEPSQEWQRAHNGLDRVRRLKVALSRQLKGAVIGDIVDDCLEDHILCNYVYSVVVAWLDVGVERPAHLCVHNLKTGRSSTC